MQMNANVSHTLALDSRLRYVGRVAGMWRPVRHQRVSGGRWSPSSIWTATHRTTNLTLKHTNSNQASSTVWYVVCCVFWPSGFSMYAEIVYIIYTSMSSMHTQATLSRFHSSFCLFSCRCSSRFSLRAIALTIPSTRGSSSSTLWRHTIVLLHTHTYDFNFIFIHLNEILQTSHS